MKRENIKRANEIDCRLDKIEWKLDFLKEFKDLPVASTPEFLHLKWKYSEIRAGLEKELDNL